METLGILRLGLATRQGVELLTEVVTLQKNQWLTIGMSNENTPGFQDTSRLMTQAVEGTVGYIEPPKALQAWKEPHRRMFAWTSRRAGAWEVWSPPLPVPKKLDPCRFTLKLQAANLRRQLVRQFGEDWVDTTTVYITNWSYYQKPLIEQLGPKRLVFDIVDDVLAFPYTFQRDKVIQAWQWLAQHASVVTAVSPTLQNLTWQQLGVVPLCLPNGVDATHFMHASKPVPSAISDPTHPSGLKVGFAGTLNHWIDFSSMLNLVTSRPDMQLYLMGRVGNFGGGDRHRQFEALKSHERVHMVGNVPYHDLPNYLHAMDILLLPRIPSPASESSSPLKLYEYLAVGKPIAVSGVPIPDDMNAFVFSDGSGSDLAQAFSFAEGEVAGLSERLDALRQEYAKRHTWQARVACIESALEMARA